MSKTKIKLLLMIIIFGAIIIFCNGDVFANVTFDKNHSYDSPSDLSDALYNDVKNNRSIDWFFTPTYSTLNGQEMVQRETWERRYSMCWHVSTFDDWTNGDNRTVKSMIDIKDGFIYINDKKIEDSKADAEALIKYYKILKDKYPVENDDTDTQDWIKNPFIKVFILTLNKDKYTKNTGLYSGVFPYNITSASNDVKTYYDISNYKLTEPEQVEAYRIRFLYVDGIEAGTWDGQPYMFTAMKTVTVQPKTGRMRIIKSDSQYSTMRLNGAQFVLYSNDKKKYIGKTNVTSKRLNIYNG